MPVPPPVHHRVLTRRTTLALGAAGLLATTACGTEARPAAAPDDDLVDEVVAQITAVSAVAAAVPRLVAVHAAHLESLGADPPAPTTSAATGPQVRSAERDHQRYLVDAAMRAESGPLARLLASMSAAVAQQLAVPGEPVVTDVEALQTTLAAEHAAVYVYGLLGGRTSATATPALFEAVSAAYAAHRGRRDHLVRELTDAGEVPVAAEPAYEVSGTPTGPDRIAAAALATERSCATTYAWLVANTVDEDRRWAITALNEAAVRELTFRGTPEMFPGAGEHADR